MRSFRLYTGASVADPAYEFPLAEVNEPTHQFVFYSGWRTRVVAWLLKRWFPPLEWDLFGGD